MLSATLVLPQSLVAIAASAPQWTQQRSTSVYQPLPRSQFGMAADDQGNIYVYGGNAGDGALADFWRFSAVSHTWQALPNRTVPPLIEPHLAVDAGGNVFAFGGIADPGFPHVSFDGHSFGLYEYAPRTATWVDLTAPHPTLGVNWPAGREDFGFVYDRQVGRLFVFGGEGPGEQAMNDLWSYDEHTGDWTRLPQAYAGSHGVPIAPREIYNLSDDNHGGFYLFGGSYLTPTAKATPPLYVNDLWHYDVVTDIWTLVAGRANNYDPALPLPRHYYGQSCDPAGNFYILDGYVSDTTNPPYFAGDKTFSYARPITLQGSVDIAGLQRYALDDFWQYDPTTGRWTDLRQQLGALHNSPAIPYVMALDSADHQFVTFGGFHLRAGASSLLTASNGVWTYPLL